MFIVNLNCQIKLEMPEKMLSVFKLTNVIESPIQTD